MGRKSGRGPSGASNGVSDPESVTTMREWEDEVETERRWRDVRRGKRERETGQENEEGKGGGKREHLRAATACVSSLNECKPRSGGSPLDLLFSSPDSL